MPASGNAMPATQRDDRRLEAGIGGAEPAKPAEPHHFGGVPSRFAAGGRGASAAYQIVSWTDLTR